MLPIAFLAGIDQILRPRTLADQLQREVAAIAMPLPLEGVFGVTRSSEWSSSCLFPVAFRLGLP
jgi:hypothetical protein